MRQYRGLTENGKWVYGYLFKIWERVYILWGTTNDVPNMTEVIPETVGQQPGLKDKNGVDIYEGDITRILWDDGEIKEYTIIWDEWGFCTDTFTELPESDQIEVIGNIHQNIKLTS